MGGRLLGIGADDGTLVADGRSLRDGTDLERTEPVETRCENACLAGFKLVVALLVEPQCSDVVYLVKALVLNLLLDFANFFLYPCDGFGIADVIRFDVRLCEQRVVHLELRIEAQGAQGWQVELFGAVVARFNVVSHEASEIGNDNAVVLEQQYFDMSF